MHEPGASLAAAFVAATTRDGLVADRRLRLLSWQPTPQPSGLTSDLPAGPFDLGPLHEVLVSGRDRVRRGAWYTPRHLAVDLVARAVDAAHTPVASVADPACGGGVFLLAAADRLRAERSPRDVVNSMWGCDIDPLAVAVAEAALWWWSALFGDPTVAGGRLVVGDALISTAIPTSSIVVGNPPFLGQLRASTASDADRRSALRDRFGSAMRPYTDIAWLFLLRAVHAVEPGGVVAMVQPSSLLGARDAGPIRDEIDARAELVDVWIDRDGGTFDAAVEACGPVLRAGTAADNDWTGTLASSFGVPDVHLDESTCLATSASVVAGFRDEYYGLVEATTEGGSGPRLVTSGAIDPLRHRVGRPVKFAKRTWTDPRVDATNVTDRAARWLEAQRGPKLLVATQTKVIEAMVDVDGSYVGSVPSIVITPDDPAQLWALAAAIHAPACTAWLLRRSAGTALSNDACKPTAGLLAALPLPVDAGAWSEATALARSIAAGSERWEEFAAVADRSYGVTDPAVRNWWLARLPVRSPAV